MPHMLLTCEHKGCNVTEGVKDYKRTLDDFTPDGEGPYSAEEMAEWMEEPIALCPEHAEARAGQKREGVEG